MDIESDYMHELSKATSVERRPWLALATPPKEGEWLVSFVDFELARESKKSEG